MNGTCLSVSLDKNEIMLFAQKENHRNKLTSVDGGLELSVVEYEGVHITRGVWFCVTVSVVWIAHCTQ